MVACFNDRDKSVSGLVLGVYSKSEPTREHRGPLLTVLLRPETSAVCVVLDEADAHLRCPSVLLCSEEDWEWLPCTQAKGKTGVRFRQALA